MTPKKTRNIARIVVITMGVVIFIAGVYGFGSKLEEFIRVARTTDEGGFALIPILNYFFATGGFICLFFWAARNGMFKDIEKPKHDLLERERELDRLDGVHWED